MDRFKHWVVSPQGFLAFAFLMAINAELRYANGSKAMAYLFGALTIALCVRAWVSWRRQKRQR
jgi:ABC-type transport system involved in cytochrome bd biosynthesis fused ATPase/permease subunit